MYTIASTQVFISVHESVCVSVSVSDEYSELSHGDEVMWMVKCHRKLLTELARLRSNLHCRYMRDPCVYRAIWDPRGRWLLTVGLSILGAIGGVYILMDVDFYGLNGIMLVSGCWHSRWPDLSPRHEASDHAWSCDIVMKLKGYENTTWYYSDIAWAWITSPWFSDMWLDTCCWNEPEPRITSPWCTDYVIYYLLITWVDTYILTAYVWAFKLHHRDPQILLLSICWLYDEITIDGVSLKPEHETVDSLQMPHYVISFVLYDVLVDSISTVCFIWCLSYHDSLHSSTLHTSFVVRE